MPGTLTVILAALLLLPPAMAQVPAPSAAGNARISGTVVSADTGQALPGARVSIEMNNLPSSMGRVVTADANGVFEFPGLAAGTYGLQAAKAGYFTRTSGRLRIAGDAPVTLRDGQTLDNLTIALHRGGAITGRLVDRSGEPVPQVQVFAQRLQYRRDGRRAPTPGGIADVTGGGGSGDLTDDLGQFRLYGLPPGDYIVVASGRDVTMTPGVFSPPGGANLAPAYYPGTSQVGEAQVVSLGPGAETAVQFAYTPAPLVRVAGIALTSDGRPAAGMRVSLRGTMPDMISLRSAGTVAGDGTFLVTGVAPGQYWIDVAPVARHPGAERGSAPVSVGAEDVTGVSVVTTPGIRISGRVTFESMFSQRGSFQLSARTAPGADGPAGEIASDLIGPDGAFELDGLSEQVTLQPVGSQWMIKSLLVDGHEMAGGPVDLTGRSAVQGIEVTVTDRLTVIAGSATDGGQPLKNHLVVLLRIDAGSVSSERVQTTWTDDTGKFQVRGMRPGEYVAGVVEFLEAGDEFSSEFQARLRTAGRRFSLDEGEPIVLDLTSTRDLQ